MKDRLVGAVEGHRPRRNTCRFNYTVEGFALEPIIGHTTQAPGCQRPAARGRILFGTADGYHSPDQAEQHKMMDWSRRACTR